MKTQLIILLAILATVSTQVTDYNDYIITPDLNDAWDNWKTEYVKVYKDHNEDYKRRVIWEKNCERIKKHNLEYEEGKKSFRMAINKLGDMAKDEYRKIYSSNPVYSEHEHSKSPTLTDNVQFTESIKSNGNRCKTNNDFTTTSAPEYIQTTNIINLSTFANALIENNATNKTTARIITTTTKLTTTLKSNTTTTIKITNTTKSTTTIKTTTKIPEYIDWRTKGFITPVKDQLGCGSCWAFSANAALEAANAKKTGKLISFSEQQLIDCSKSYGTFGCDGGWMTNAFKYVIANKGINNDTIYPYEDIDTGMCRSKANAIAGKCSSFVNLPKYNETRLTLALLTIPAISVGINSDLESFQFYEKGVYYDPDCDPTIINHGVTVVGYGTDPIDGDYYIVKNSWGEWWGESGYIRMARNRNNNCGIASFPNYPVV